jgi:hypothetical protein
VGGARGQKPAALAVGMRKGGPVVLLRQEVLVYRFISSLRAYVLVAQDSPSIELRTRDDDDNWSTRVYRAGDQVAIAAIHCTLDVDSVYEEARKNVPR